MFHKAPAQDELKKKIQNLQDEYIKMKGDNLERLKLIKLIQSICESKEQNNHHEAVLGSCVYGLIKIGKGYDLFCGEKEKSRFSFFGSELGILLQKCLEISYENSLGEQRALIYLTHFYHYAKAHLEETVLNDIGKTIHDLLLNLAKKTSHLSSAHQ